MTVSSADSRDRAIAAALAAALLAVYLTTFAGVFRSVDELALFAGAGNLVQAGNLRPDLVRFAQFHNYVGTFEPAYPILAAPLYWLAGHWPGISSVHAVLLLNPILTAATGGVLYLLGRRLGYGGGSSLALALSFGLASMAWPFTKSFLREPAVGLLWTVAFLGITEFLDVPGWRSAATAIVPALLAIGVKVTGVALLPVVAGLLLWAMHRARRLSPRTVGVVVVAFGAAGWLAFVLLAQRGYLPAGVVLRMALAPFTREGLTAWYGLLASPGKSIFVYSPVLLLGVLGWPAFFRRHAPLAAGVLLAAAAVLLSVQASAAWWSGLTWGPRFLLPLLPLALIPVLEVLPGRRWAWAIAGLSAAYQAVVSSSAWTVAYQAFFRANILDPDTTVGLDWSRWAEAPSVQILRQWGRASWDLVWLHPGLAGEVKLDLGLALALAGGVAFAGIALTSVWRGRRTGVALSLSAATVVAAASCLLIRGYRDLPDYPGLSAETARRLAADLSDHPMSPDRIVVVSPDIYTYFWIGLLKGRADTVWISPAEQDGFDSLIPERPNPRLSVVVDRPHIASNYAGDALVSWLNTNAYRLASYWMDGYEVFHYAARPDPSRRSLGQGLTWPNGVALDSIVVPESVEPGSALPLDLTLRRLSGDWRASDVLFTHLVGPDGTVVSGQDGPLQYGNLASAGWRAGDVAVDRRGIWIPAEAPPGLYDLVVGFADGGQFVPLSLSTGQTVDYAAVAQVTIAAP